MSCGNLHSGENELFEKARFSRVPRKEPNWICRKVLFKGQERSCELEGKKASQTKIKGGKTQLRQIKVNVT